MSQPVGQEQKMEENKQYLAVKFSMDVLLEAVKINVPAGREQSQAISKIQEVQKLVAEAFEPKKEEAK